MNWHLATRTTAVGLRRHLLIVTLMFVTLWSASNAFGQTMQFYPIRSAPLGSPVGTLGNPVTPEFNSELGCWELEVMPGVEVDIDLQVFGWGSAPGSPFIGAVQGSVLSAGYDNGVGADLHPKGWPESPRDGAYQEKGWCEGGGGNGLPCGFSFFELTCEQQGGGTCVTPSPRWIMQRGPDFNFIATPTLDYAWAVATRDDLGEIDDGTTRTLGGLILEVPLSAAGTYVIALDSDPNNSFLSNITGAPVPLAALTPACITVLGNDDRGRCCSDIGPNVVCGLVSPQVCSTRPQPRSFATGETCGGGNACPTCVNDGDCDDGDTCTADTCDETGQCVHTIICPEMRFYPIRMAPLGSPAGTVGYSVTPEFNSDLDCWELEVLPGFELDIDVQVGGWGNAPGNPPLGLLTARLNSAGYSNGVGADLNPKGWPGDPVQGAYQANRHCGLGGDLSPCVVPFDTTCNNSTNGLCIPSSDWVFTPAAGDFHGIDTSVLGYGWFAAPSVSNVSFDPDPSSFRTLGGLILEIPYDAQGRYVIDFDPDSNNTFMLTGSGDLMPGLTLKRACITVAPDPAKNRYLTFLPREPGPVAYKLDMVSSLFHPDAIVSGWIGAPDAKGIASLEPDPVTREWTEAIVHVTGCEITPVAEFELRASADGGATFLPPVTLKTADQPIGNKWWGDVGGHFNGAFWTPPQGVTNFIDVLAIRNTFQGRPTAPGLVRADVAPREPNRVANFEDVLFVILAFKGEPYPFGCPGDPCHDKLISPCP